MPRIYSIRPTWSLKGRRSQGLRGFTGKPFHPPLTDFPIVCYTLAAVFDLISYFSDATDPKAHDFFVAATFVMVAGFHREPRRRTHRIHGLVEGDPSRPQERADRQGQAHAGLAHDQLARDGDADRDRHHAHRHHPACLRLRAGTDELVSWLVLSLLAGALVTFGAAYGGTLVFEYGFNVENVEEVWKESEEDHVRLPRGGSSS